MREPKIMDKLKQMLLRITLLYLWPVSALLLLIFVSIQIFDRYRGNSTVLAFYVDQADSTCIVMREKGKNTMFCLDVDHMLEFEGEE